MSMDNTPDTSNFDDDPNVQMPTTAMGFIADALKGYGGEDIKTNLLLMVLASIKGAAVWFVVGFLPIPYYRKRRVHQQLMRGERINWFQVFFGRISVIGCVVTLAIFAVIVFVILNAN
jgi:hypothetical protein